MANRAQQESGEERVTAKSRPMMNLTARTPSFVSSSASSNPGRTSYGYQDPGKSVTSDDRTGKLVQPSQPDYTQEVCRSWSSQEWKSGAAEHDRSGKPEGISWDTLHLTLKQMFDVTAQLVNNQEEINCLDKILYGKNSWTRLSLIDDEIVINLQRTKVYVVSDSVLCLGKVLQHPESNEAWKNRVAGIRSEKSYRNYDAINGESTEFEWNIFPGFTTLQLCDKISDLLSNLGQTPETFTGRILFMSMFNDISCDRRQQR